MHKSLRQLKFLVSSVSYMGISKQMVRHWCSQSSEGRQKVHDEQRSGQLSLISVDFSELVRQSMMEPPLHDYGAEQPFSI
ncbi:hypothetical protein TNCV_1725031 [Trichonephila clavipes]|nr:hypothetical protein TNCV_1725031 [Trichonephila clavipes]